MKLEPGKEYMVNGERLKFVRQFNARGIVRRFAYPNGQVLDFNPGEITKLQEEMPYHQSAGSWGEAGHYLKTLSE